jgi:hypothetical protein
LVAIDVNTGRYVGKKNLEDTILKTNLEAVQEIAYQLRLRNCGGIIILDLIDMEKEENKQRVYRALEEALKRDRARPSILKISELGLVEMTRKRTRDTIVRALCESCSHCEGKGFIKSKTTVAYEVLREIEREGIERDVTKILVQAHPDVIDILAIDERETMDQIERRYKKQIYLQSVLDSHIEQFEVAGDKKPGKTAGDFSEVVQTYKTHTSSNTDRDKERGRGGRDRGRSGGRDRGGRDNNRDSNRDREPQPRRNPGEEQLSIISSGSGGASSGGGGLPVPRQIKIPSPSQQPMGEPGNADSQQPAQTDMQPPFQPNDENYGNRVGPVITANTTAPAAGGDDFYDEEDRLAFLRAQATQDAALARLRSSEGSPSQPRTGGAGGGGRDQGRNNNNANRDNNRGRRGRRGGGKFSNNRDARGPGNGGGQGGGQNRNPRPFTPRPPGTGPQIIMPGGGGQQQNPGNSGPAQSTSHSNDTSDSNRGDRGGNGGDNDGGPGDRSQPPV